MKLNLETIFELQSQGDKRVPAYDIAKVRANTLRAPRWVHFGGGSICRTFVCDICEKLLQSGAMDSGLVVVVPRNVEERDAVYLSHDNLFINVRLPADGKIFYTVSACVAAALALPDGEDRKTLKDIFAAPSLQLCTFTITEKGYDIFDGKGDIRADVLVDAKLGPDRCSNIMCALAGLLLERFCRCPFPLPLVSLDNCHGNGDVLKKAVLAIAHIWQFYGYCGSSFVKWIEKNVTFPITMDDKIAPSPSLEVADYLASDGWEDMLPQTPLNGTYYAPFACAEPYGCMVIEDSFPAGRPSFERAGVIMAARTAVNKAERVKVTACLNPLHTALAVFGCLLGYKSIADEMKNPAIKNLVCGIGYSEGLPAVEDCKSFPARKFLDEVVQSRLTNALLGDSPARIATGTSQKVGVRYGNTIKWYAERGRADCLKYIPFAIAGWLRYLMGADDCGNAMPLSPDPMLKELTSLMSAAKLGGDNCGLEGLSRILSDKKIFGLNLYDVGVGQTAENYFVKMSSGIGAVKRALNELEEYV